MATQRTIAIIGACSANGKIASKKLASGNTRVLLADENMEDLVLLKNEIEAGHSGVEVEIKECIKEAGWEADIVVLALNWQAEKEIFTMIKPFMTGKTVISFSKDNNCLLPYSKVISIKEDRKDWANEMEEQINNDF
ncbi:MAG: oxidoreductase [Chitinophagaceae bacterium]|nr:oxidoreductase [Chitinophagaceae bacterium]